MSSLVSDNFRIFAAKQFIESLGEPYDNSGGQVDDTSVTGLRDRSKIYLFIGRPQPWNEERYAGSSLNINELNPPTPEDSVDYLNEIYDDMISLKRIYSTDVSLVVKKRIWKSGVQYDMYRHDYSELNPSPSGAAKLYDAQYYVMNDLYQIYKCIFNGANAVTDVDGKVSTVKPTGTSSTIFSTSDGYRWKYMYTLGIDDFVKFVSSDFIPVKEDTSVKQSAVPGAIYQCTVENAGTGCTPGTYYAPIIGDGNTSAVVKIQVGGSTSVQFNGRISSAVIESIGSGYTYGTVNLNEVYDSLSNAESRTNELPSGIGNPTTLPIITTIISPPGGHGSNAESELGSYRVMISKSLEFLDGNGDIPVDMTFRRYGLIENPKTFSSTVDFLNQTATVTKCIKMQDTDVEFGIETIITQNSTGAKGRVVHWDSINKILRYYQNEYINVSQTETNQYKSVAFSGTGQVSGFTLQNNDISAVPDTSFTGTVAGIEVSFVGGYSNPEIKPYSGNILYIEHRKPIIRSNDQIEDIKLVIEF
jgi:hypothetical protein